MRAGSAFFGPGRHGEAGRPGARYHRKRLARFGGIASGKAARKIVSSCRPGFAVVTVKMIQIGEGEQKAIPPVELRISDCGSPGPRLDYLRLLPSDASGGTIRGSVRLDRGWNKTSGPPVKGANIVLVCSGDAACPSTRTDSNGEFVFEDLPPENYTVRVSRPGFYPLDMPFYNVQKGLDSVYWPISIERCPLGTATLGFAPKGRLVSVNERYGRQAAAGTR